MIIKRIIFNVLSVVFAILIFPLQLICYLFNLNEILKTTIEIQAALLNY